jgi:hypothetical protein
VLAVAVVAVAALVGIAPATAQSSSAKPKSTEIGVTANEVHIAVVADVDTPLAPGLFQGVVTGVQGAAKYLDSKAGGGGIAGRKLVVDFIDSKLNATTSRNAIITACQNDLALVGTSALFLPTVDDEVNCPDQTGKAVGLPDISAIATSIPQSCAPTSFPVLGTQIVCSTKDANPQTYNGNQGAEKYLLSKTKGGLHGPMVVSNDTKDANRGGTVLALAAQHAGIKADQGTTVTVSGRDPQSAFTPIVQRMKADGSNYSLVTAAANSAVELRSEAQLQGLDSSAVTWECVSCYGNPTVQSSASVMDGTAAPLQYLPFDEVKSNAMLRAFITNVGADKADGFSVYGWAATLAFADAMKAVLAKDGVNGITRQSTIDGIKSLTDFDAGGMLGTHSFKTQALTACFVLTQFRNGKWVRVSPTKAGTFDCKPANAITMQANLLGS